MQRYKPVYIQPRASHLPPRTIVAPNRSPQTQVAPSMPPQSTTLLEKKKETFDYELKDGSIVDFELYNAPDVTAHEEWVKIASCLMQNKEWSGEEVKIIASGIAPEQVELLRLKLAEKIFEDLAQLGNTKAEIGAEIAQKYIEIQKNCIRIFEERKAVAQQYADAIKAGADSKEAPSPKIMDIQSLQTQLGQAHAEAENQMQIMRHAADIFNLIPRDSLEVRIKDAKEKGTAITGSTGPSGVTGTGEGGMFSHSSSSTHREGVSAPAQTSGIARLSAH